MDFTVVLGALLVRAGFAVHAAGMSRSKNSAAAVMRHLCDSWCASLAFWAVGYAILFGGGRVFWLDWRNLLGPGEGQLAAGNFAAGASAVLVASGIVPGVLGERARFWPSLGVSA